MREPLTASQQILRSPHVLLARRYRCSGSGAFTRTGTRIRAVRFHLRVRRLDLRTARSRGALSSSSRRRRRSLITGLIATSQCKEKDPCRKRRKQRFPDLVNHNPTKGKRPANGRSWQKRARRAASGAHSPRREPNQHVSRPAFYARPGRSFWLPNSARTAAAHKTRIVLATDRTGLGRVGSKGKTGARLIFARRFSARPNLAHIYLRS